MLLSLLYLINEACGYIHQKLLKKELQEKLEACVVEMESVKQERDALILQVQGLQEALKKAKDMRIDLLLDATSQKKQIEKMQVKIQVLEDDVWYFTREIEQWNERFSHRL